MPELKPVLNFSGLKKFFNPAELSGRLPIFLAENLASLLENLFGRKVYFDASNFNIPADLSAENLQLLNRLKESGITDGIKQAAFYADEPKIYQFSGQANSPEQNTKGDWCGGISIESATQAALKAAAEILERYCLYICPKNEIVLESYGHLKSRGAVSPLAFAGISEEQRKQEQFKKFIFNENTVFGWTEMKNLMNDKAALVPAQLVYLRYRNQDEPIIYHTNTTGAAAGRSFEEAAYRGLLEAIERDAWMITFYNKLSPPVIDLSSPDNFPNAALRNFLKELKRYRLNPVAIDITTDLKIPTVLGIVRDAFSSGQIGIGTKTDLDIEEATLGALLEAQKNRVWVRNYPDQDFNEEKILKTISEHGHDLIHRTRFWQSPERRKDLEFLWKGPKQNMTKFKDLNMTSKPAEKLKIVLAELKSKGYIAYAKDVTISEAKKLGFFVVKTLVPQLQPMHLHECHPFLGGERLYNIPVRLGYFPKPKTFDEISRMPPHPFA